MLQGQGSEFEANVLFVGTRDPFEVKLEVTHFWGRPLFHILITETRLHILSFAEKRYYLTNVREPLPSNLPPIRLDLDQLWAIARGFPALHGHARAVSTRENQISLMTKEGNIVQQIEFYDQKNFPVQIIFPVQDLKLSFSDFTNDNNIQYAKKTRLYDNQYKTLLTLDTKQAVFNKPVNRSVFELTIPPDFERIQDDRILDTH